MRSRKAPRGPLSHFEATLVEFYRYLARSLTAGRAGGAGRGRPASPPYHCGSMGRARAERASTAAAASSAMSSR